MAVCERCGSIQVYRIQPSLIDKGFAAIDSREPYKCGRCGWKGRRVWSPDDSDSFSELELAEGLTDPALAVLDDLDRPRRASTVANRKPRSSRRRKSQPQTAIRRKKSSSDFDLSAIELAESAAASTDSTTNGSQRPSDSWDERRANTAARRVKRSQWRQIIGAVVVSALTLVLFAILGVSQACGGDPGL